MRIFRVLSVLILLWSIVLPSAVYAEKADSEALLTSEDYNQLDQEEFYDENLNEPELDSEFNMDEKEVESDQGDNDVDVQIDLESEANWSNENNNKPESQVNNDNKEELENEKIEDFEIDKKTTNKIEAKSLQLMSTSESIESQTSRLGHLRNNSVRIYQDYKKLSNYVEAGNTYTHEVYYIKRQAEYNGGLYYLISRSPSSVIGVVGWVKSTDMSSHTHVGVDKVRKTFYIKGTNSAYTKAWGGSKNYSYQNLSAFKGQKFEVNLTEKVGNNIWYRGVINGQTAWIHKAHLSTSTLAVESNTSRLGHLNNSNVRIYKKYDRQSDYLQAGTTYTNEVYYIKKQAEYNGGLYYLISRSPSSVNGVVGWVKSTDMSSHTHVGVDKVRKTFYIKGTNSAYTKAWGGSKNYSYQNLSAFKGQKFEVNLTEKVGNNIWYRGVINGQTAWIHEAHLSTSTLAVESNTSRLGHLNNSNVRIYKKYDRQSDYLQAGTTYTNEVYYIKKQAEYNGGLYYLISRSPSSVNGVVGWVKSTDMSSHTHVGVDKVRKTFYIKGTNSAYTKAWGGSKNYSYQNLSALKGQKFEVNLTEKVGNNIWYRGVINGQTAWIHEAHLSANPLAVESSTSRLGHLRNAEVQIYQDYLIQSEFIKAGLAYTNEVYYIKKQAENNGVLYYLISRSPSSVNGVVGWVKSTDLSSHTHVGIDKVSRNFYLNGKGSAFTKAWGGSKNINTANLESLKGQTFQVNLTEKVGNNIWYRGSLNGQHAWVHSSQISTTPLKIIDKVNYNVTYESALNIQMTKSPQTDKYRNQNAYIHGDYVNFVQVGSIKGNNINIRKEPKLGSAYVDLKLNNGARVIVMGEVTGDSHAGSTKWYKIIHNRKVLYVHSTLANITGTTAITTANVNVRESATTTSHVFGTVSQYTEVNVVRKGSTWHEISYNTWRNAKRSDVEMYLDPNKNDEFQHLLLTSSVGVSSNELNKLLVGKGILQEKGQSFIDGGRTYSVNEVYLISHALLETGNGTSKLANGIEVGLDSNGKPTVVTSSNRSSLRSIKKTYNMFGIGAVDADPNRGGAIRAYEEGWFTPEAAIIGGSRFIGERYIHNSHNQNTIYKMRWNPASPGFPQYATDIAWATKQTVQIRNFYNQLSNPSLHFEIPVYK